VTLTLRYAVRSDLGLVRGNNEDSVYAGPRLLAIADGMGGHAAGEVASKIVIGTMEPLDDDRPPADLIGALRAAVHEANHRIADAVEHNNELDGMGTTLTALRFAGAKVALVHVGDSRAYLLRDGTLTQITHDDTYVQYLVDTGKLTADEAKDHPRKSVILRALRGAEVEPDVSIREARAGDRYLLCSDGLSDVVSIETMAEALRIPDPQECADRLVELALRSGGPDNVTVIVADVVDARPGDVVYDVPVRDGAFVDQPVTDPQPADSPAERAAAISRPARQPAAVEPVKRRGRWRTPAIVLAILVLICAALGGTYAWAQTQYYVAPAGDEVAIYQGVKASFGPIKFSEVYRNTDLKLSDLNSAWRSQVESGITANSKGDAYRIVQRLHHERKPLCSTVTAAPTTSPATSTGTTTGGADLTTATSTAPRAPSTSARRSTSVVATRPTAPARRVTSSVRAAGRPAVSSAVASARSRVSSATQAATSRAATTRPASSRAATSTPATSPTPTPSVPATGTPPTGSPSVECR
jgi:PPM family protein phosphatase